MSGKGAVVMVQWIDIERLKPHPENANVMAERMARKLRGHIERSGRYPPVIVREVADGYEILDGHHRVAVLRDLGETRARCVVWRGVDDDEARLLLATLNRVRGEDDPQKRGRLLERLQAAATDEQALLRLLPDTREKVAALIRVATPPHSGLQAMTSASEERDGMMTPFTVFLRGDLRREVVRRLREIDAQDRGRALMKALGMCDEGGDS